MQPSITPDNRRWWALGLLAAAQFMVIMDTSIIGVALPDIQDALGFSQSGLSWIFNAYVVAFGGLYALFFAWNRLRPRALWRWLCCGSFALLALALLLLARALHFGPGWNGAAIFLLAAYLVAPCLIWRLTRATHAEEEGNTS